MWNLPFICLWSISRHGVLHFRFIFYRILVIFRWRRRRRWRGRRWFFCLLSCPRRCFGRPIDWKYTLLKEWVQALVLCSKTWYRFGCWERPTFYRTQCVENSWTLSESRTWSNYCWNFRRYKWPTWLVTENLKHWTSNFTNGVYCVSDYIRLKLHDFLLCHSNVIINILACFTHLLI